MRTQKANWLSKLLSTMKPKRKTPPQPASVVSPPPDVQPSPEGAAQDEFQFVRPGDPRTQSHDRKVSDLFNQLLDIARRPLCQICGKHPTGPDAVAAIQRIEPTPGNRANMKVSGICASCASGKSDAELSQLLRKTSAPLANGDGDSGKPPSASEQKAAKCADVGRTPAAPATEQGAKKPEKYDTSSPHFSAGMRLQSQGRFKEALACFEAWLQKEPSNVIAWNCKGLALRGLARWDEAMACFDQALKVLPNDAPTWGNMGRTLHDKGDYKAAIHVLDKCLDTKPSADLWSFKGSCLGKLGQALEALSCFDKAVALDPTKAEYWSNKGTACSQLARFDDALSSYKKAIDAEPDCAAAWYNRAEAEERLGQPEAAIQSLEKFLSLAPATMQSQTTNAQERIQNLKGLAEAKFRNAASSAIEAHESGDAETLLKNMQALGDISERIAKSPTEWRGDKVVTAEKTVRVPGLGLLGAVTLKGEVTREDSRYKCRTEVICLPMATKNEEKELFNSLDEAKQKIIESWAAEAGALCLLLTTMEKIKHR